MAETLFEDSLYVVGGTVPADRPTTWIAPGLSGWLAVPCYVLKSEGAALIIDSGLAIHWDRIEHELDRLLADTWSRALIMTRREPDAICNLPQIVARYALQSVYCGGVISPLDFFERVDQASAASHIRALAGPEVEWRLPGETVPVGDLRLQVLRTTLRVLPKNHFYEPRSATLFASDTWGLLPQVDEAGIDCVRIDDHRLSLPAILRYVRHRFDWLAGIDTSPMQQELTELLETTRIDRICASYGAIIEGRGLVTAVIQRTIQALDALSREAPVDRLETLDCIRLLAALGG